MTADWIDQFPGLERLEPAVRETLLRRSAVVTLPEGTAIFGPGRSPENLLLLLEGRVRVQQVSEAGREIVLYRVEAGQSCVLTTACLLAHEDYSAEGIAETDLRAVAIPRRVFDDLVAGSAAFRDFIFTAYARRITELFRVIEEIAFQRVDIRLAQRLVALARGTGQVRATHQQLAVELGTAREVVSRQLGEFQRRGWVRQARGVIDITDMAGLGRLAAIETG
jgi:CRP/FNR family transcriptional regulator